MDLKMKWVVNGAMALAAVYIFMNQDALEEAFSLWFPIGALAAGLVVFNNNFVEKKPEQPREPPVMGPPEPFIPQQETQWDIGADGRPIKQAPRAPRQGGRYT